jgi:hypothetical protein
MAINRAKYPPVGPSIADLTANGGEMPLRRVCSRWGKVLEWKGLQFTGKIKKD